MSPVIVRYPLDPTGRNPNNLVVGEVHELVRRQVRSVATLYGGFFSESLRIVDTATQQPLSASQYEAVELYEAASARFGKEVCAVALITDPTVGDSVTLSYQAVGGEFSTSALAVTQLIDALQLDNRPATWAGLIDKPNGFEPAPHLHDVGDTYGWEFIVNALERVRAALALGDRMNLDAIYRYADQVGVNAAAGSESRVSAAIAAAMAAHLAAADPHPQYLLKSQASGLAVAAVRQPVNVSPVANAVGQSAAVTLLLDTYRSLYDLPQQAVQFQVSIDPQFVGAALVDVTLVQATNTYTTDAVLAGTTTYSWRGRFQDSEGSWSNWSDVTQFTTAAYSVAQPSITAPATGSTVTTNGVTLTASAFATVGGSGDTQKNTDWEIWTGANGGGTLVWSSEADATHLSSIAVPPNVLANNASYHMRVRYRGNVYGVSAWSADKSFMLNYPLFPTTVGEAYGGGYYAGDWSDGAHNYAVIVAAKSYTPLPDVGEMNLPLMTSYHSSQNIGGDSRTDFYGNQIVLSANDSATPNDTSVLPYWMGSPINGYGDWFLPPIDLLRFIFTAFNPQGASTPANFKTGGVDAFAAAPYWSSTQYDGSDTTTTQGPPIYGNVTTRYYYQHPSGVTTVSPGDYWPTGTNVGDTAGDFLGWESVVGATPPIGGPAGMVQFDTGYNYFNMVNPDTGLADTQVYGYSRGYEDNTSSQIVGYQPGTTSTTYYYNGLLVNFGGGAVNESNGTRTTAHYGRAVRLVQKS